MLDLNWLKNCIILNPKNMLKKIKNYLQNNLEKFISLLIVIITLFRIFITYSQSNIVLGIFLFTTTLIFLVLCSSTLKFKNLTFLFYSLALIFIFETLKLWEVGKPEFIKILFGGNSSGGYLEFIKIPILTLGLSFSISETFLERLVYFKRFLDKKFKLSSKFLFYLNLSISIIFSLYYSVLKILDHLSFDSHAIDYGIFDQAIYLLSRGQLPASTIQQFTNLFYDHQHFSIAILAPLYLIGAGFQGITLIAITPFLLITFPAILLYFSAREFSKNFLKIDFNFPWIISFVSFILFYHPFTQAAVGFYFHEKYILPTILGLLLLSLVKGLSKSPKWFVVTFFTTIIWLGLKEDQWIFIMAFILQISFWILYKSKSIISKNIFFLKAYLGSSFFIATSYGIFFLPWFVKKYGNLDYSKMYEPAILAVKNFLRSGNFPALISDLNLFDNAKNYLYSNFIVFDFFGSLFLPFSVAGNYAERVLSANQSLVAPNFQYGVDVPIYVSLGVIFIFLMLLKRKQLQTSYLWIVFIFLNFFIGFGSVLGWNQTYYLAYRLPASVRNYNSTSEERESFNTITKAIPRDSSLVTTAQYVPHLSARKEIAYWPEVKVLSEIPVRSLDKKNDLINFQYWLLPKDKYSEQVTNLTNNRYVVDSETKMHILMRKI